MDADEVELGAVRSYGRRVNGKMQTVGGYFRPDVEVPYVQDPAETARREAMFKAAQPKKGSGSSAKFMEAFRNRTLTPAMQHAENERIKAVVAKQASVMQPKTTGLEGTDDRSLVLGLEALKRRIEFFVNMPLEQSLHAHGKPAPPVAHLQFNVALLGTFEREMRKRGMDPSDPRFGTDWSTIFTRAKEEAVALSKVEGYTRVLNGKTVEVKGYWNRTSPFDGADFSKMTSTGKHFGTHGSTLYNHPSGEQYLVKHQDRFRSVLDRQVSLLQGHVGVKAPDVHLASVGGKDAAVHHWLPGKEALKYNGFDPTTLSPEDLLQLQKEHAFDWMISNHDSHPGQFVRTPEGNLMGLDKGQAFRYFGKDKLDVNYHPNRNYGEREPVYNTMHREHQAGRLQLHDPATHPELKAFIEKLQAIPDDEYRDLLRPYAEETAKTGFLGGGLAKPNDVEHFLDKAVERKNNLMKDMVEHHAKGKHHGPAVSKLKSKDSVPMKDVFRAAKKMQAEMKKHSY